MKWIGKMDQEQYNKVEDLTDEELEARMRMIARHAPALLELARVEESKSYLKDRWGRAIVFAAAVVAGGAFLWDIFLRTINGR